MAMAVMLVQAPISCSKLNALPRGVPSRVQTVRFGQRRAAFLRARASAAVDASKVVPQADRVLVRLEELPEKSEGGVLLPKSAVKFERYLVGEVISVGKEADTVEKGEKVMFSDINAYEVNLGTNEKHCFCKAGDLLAIIK